MSFSQQFVFVQDFTACKRSNFILITTQWSYQEKDYYLAPSHPHFIYRETATASHRSDVIGKKSSSAARNKAMTPRPPQVSPIISGTEH